MDPQVKATTDITSPQQYLKRKGSPGQQWKAIFFLLGDLFLNLTDHHIAQYRTTMNN